MLSHKIFVPEYREVNNRHTLNFIAIGKIYVRS